MKTSKKTVSIFHRPKSFCIKDPYMAYALVYVVLIFHQQGVHESTIHLLGPLQLRQTDNRHTDRQSNSDELAKLKMKTL